MCSSLQLSDAERGGCEHWAIYDAVRDVNHTDCVSTLLQKFGRHAPRRDFVGDRQQPHAFHARLASCNWLPGPKDCPQRAVDREVTIETTGFQRWHATELRTCQTVHCRDSDCRAPLCLQDIGSNTGGDLRSCASGIDRRVAYLRADG